MADGRMSLRGPREGGSMGLVSVSQSDSDSAGTRLLIIEKSDVHNQSYEEKTLTEMLGVIWGLDCSSKYRFGGKSCQIVFFFLFF